MSHHEHKHLAGARSVTVHVAIVSSTRTPETDTAGPAIQAALEAAGHRVVGREILPDDGAAIRARIRSLHGGPARAAIFAGGTGISKRDGTFEAVSGLLDREIPGFGELFRVLSFQEIGAAAMLSRATAGLCGELVIFAIPGSRAAGRLAVEQLIGPELAHIDRELSKESAAPPAPAPAAEPEIPEVGADRVEAELVEDTPQQPSQGPLPDVHEIPSPDAPSERPVAGWLSKLHDLGGRLRRGMRIPLPEPLASNAAARSVLENAGEMAVIEFAQGRYLAFGFPDLRRSRSRVLLVGPGSPWCEVVALHRTSETGIPRDEAGGLVAGGLGRRSREVTGSEYPGDGRLLAVEGGRIHALDLDGRAWSWDGRKRRDEGPPAGVVASLLLQWSQR